MAQRGAAGTVTAPRFVPTRGLANAHLQTVVASLFAPAPRVNFVRERWDTPDGDFIDVDLVPGPEDAPWVQLFHGLEGSSHSSYARILMDFVRKRGWRGSVSHFRGRSGEPNRLARAYHSGDSEEADWVLRRLKQRAGAAPLYAVGVSLGGNVLLKWLGEQGEAACPIVSRAIAVCAPVDLTAGGEALSRGVGLLYGWHFLRTLKPGALERAARFPGLFDTRAVRRGRTLKDFDDVVTAPLHGFRDAYDYWHRSSSKPWLERIAVPTLLLNARDDPFQPESALPTEREVSPAVTIEFPERGGHVGFVSGPFPGNIEWLPRRIFHFIEHRE